MSHGTLHRTNSGHRKGSLVPQQATTTTKGVDSRDSRGSGGSAGEIRGDEGGMGGGELHFGTLTEKLERLSRAGLNPPSNDHNHHNNNNNPAPMLSDTDRKTSIMSEYSEESGLTYTSPREKNAAGDPPSSSPTIIHYPSLTDFFWKNKRRGGGWG